MNLIFQPNLSPFNKIVLNDIFLQEGLEGAREPWLRQITFWRV